MCEREQLLKEYETVKLELDSIRHKLNVVKHVAETKLKCAKTEKEKSIIFAEFKDNIHKDKHFKQHFKQLNDKKRMLEISLSATDTDTEPIQPVKVTVNLDDLSATLDELIAKYKTNICIPIKTSAIVPIKKQKCNISNTDDKKHMKKIGQLIESLKLDLNKN